MRTPAQLEAKDLMNAIDGLGIYFLKSKSKFFSFKFKKFCLGTNEAALIGNYNI